MPNSRPAPIIVNHLVGSEEHSGVSRVYFASLMGQNARLWPCKPSSHVPLLLLSSSGPSWLGHRPITACILGILPRDIRLLFLLLLLFNLFQVSESLNNRSHGVQRLITCSLADNGMVRATSAALGLCRNIGIHLLNLHVFFQKLLIHQLCVLW